MTESIIVYRNPIEQQLWEGIVSNPDLLFTIGCSGVVAIVCVFILSKLDEMIFGRVPKWKWWHTNRINVILFLSAVAAIITFNLM